MSTTETSPAFTNAELQEWAERRADDAGRLARALLDARKKNAELNRRCQSAESGLRVKLEDVKRQGGSFGRALAVAGYMMAEAENARLREALRETISYAEQLDLLAYDGLERDTPHAVICKAREALEFRAGLADIHADAPGRNG